MRRWVYKSMNDGALMEAYAKGQVVAFECLYLRHKVKVFNFLRRQCDIESIAEELTHDTWIAVINQAGRYQKQAKFTTWLFRIAHNRLVDHWRKQNGSPQLLKTEILDQIADDRCANVLSPEMDELLKNLEVLSEHQLEALLLKIEGFSHQEIAHITGAKQETVKSRLRYASKYLRQLRTS